MRSKSVQDADEMFSHGGAYPEENQQIRRRPCGSCAFVSSPGTVRPANISISELEEATSNYDDFLCHCLDAGGRAFTCAGWAARFGDTSAEVQRKIVESR